VRFIGWLAVAAFSISAALHLSTFLPAPPFSAFSMMWVHLVVMLVFLTAVFAVRPRGPRPTFGLFPWRREGGSWAFWRPVPVAVRALAVVLFLYAGVNFVLFTQRAPQGSMRMVNGQPVLTTREGRSHVMTPEEYQRYGVSTQRAFSGHWMVFSLVAAALLLYVHPAQRRP
jgi:hypothetical protein